MLSVEPFAEDHQGQQRSPHRGQGPQEGGGGGRGENDGDVGSNIPPGNAQAGQQPVLHGTGLQSPDHPLAENDHQKDEGDGVPGGQEGVQGDHLVSSLGDGVAKAVEGALEKDKGHGQPFEGLVLGGGFQEQHDLPVNSYG